MATVKPKDLKFEEAALQKRLEFVRSLKTALADEETLTSHGLQRVAQLSGVESPSSHFGSTAILIHFIRMACKNPMAF